MRLTAPEAPGIFRASRGSALTARVSSLEKQLPPEALREVSDRHEAALSTGNWSSQEAYLIRLNAALVLWTQGRLDDARSQFDAGFRICPQAPDSLYREFLSDSRRQTSLGSERQ